MSKSCNILTLLHSERPKLSKSVVDLFNPIAPRKAKIVYSFGLSECNTRLAKRREILIFPRTAGNTGNSQELLVIPGKYWEICFSPTR